MVRIKYKVNFKIPEQIYQRMHDDLKRKHDFAYERIGFLFTTSKQLTDNVILILAKEYIPIDDDDYIEDRSVGAKINSRAIRMAMQRILENNEGCFHVHMHNHDGIPFPSHTDIESVTGIIDSFRNVSFNQANGLIIHSRNSVYVTVKIVEKDELILPEVVSIIGFPIMKFHRVKRENNKKLFERQTFLGKSAQQMFKNIKVGIVGYGGGGSHIGQQLAHLGIENIFVFDDDYVEETNINRLIGARFNDAKKVILKTAVAKRLIKKILPTAKVNCVNSRWQLNPEILQGCDIVFGCVDTFSERQQLESECRRYLIPYIDIGMDIYKAIKEPFAISGQIILSMPGYPCMSCLGFITEKKLGLEAAKYGKVGGRPQVVWPNGVLASTAVGLFVDIVTGWTNHKRNTVYLSYDGNSGTINEHIRLEYCNKDCIHFTFNYLGVPVYSKLD